MKTIEKKQICWDSSGKILEISKETFVSFVFSFVFLVISLCLGMFCYVLLCFCYAFVPHRQCGGCKIFLWHILLLLLLLLLHLPLSDLFRARAPPYRRPVQSAAPIGDDGQLMSCTSCTSCGRPVLWHSTNAFLFYTRQTFPFLFRSSVFSVPIRFLFSARQLFSSLLRRWGFPTAR